MRLLMIIFASLPVLPFMSQADSAKVPEDRADAIYLTYADFRRNAFISKDQVISEIRKDNVDFMGKVTYPDKLSFNSPAGPVTVETKTIWGFYQNKSLYVNYNGEFFRVPVFGSVCYLVATVTVITGFYDPMAGYGVNSGRTREIREFIINFYDGVVRDFTMERAEELLSRDAGLFTEYKALGRRERKTQINRYIRRYNDAHPVYFLKGS